SNDHDIERVACSDVLAVGGHGSAFCWVFPVTEVPVGERRRMGADGLPHQRPVVLIGGLHFPVASSVLYAADVPEQQHGPRGWPELLVRQDLGANDVDRIRAPCRGGGKSIEKRAEAGAEAGAGALEVRVGEIDCQRCFRRQCLRQPKKRLELLLRRRYHVAGFPFLPMTFDLFSRKTRSLPPTISREPVVTNSSR